MAEILGVVEEAAHTQIKLTFSNKINISLLCLVLRVTLKSAKIYVLTELIVLNFPQDCSFFKL